MIDNDHNVSENCLPHDLKDIETLYDIRENVVHILENAFLTRRMFYVAENSVHTDTILVRWVDGLSIESVRRVLKDYGEFIEFQRFFGSEGPIMEVIEKTRQTFDFQDRMFPRQIKVTMNVGTNGEEVTLPAYTLDYGPAGENPSEGSPFQKRLWATYAAGLLSEIDRRAAR